MLFKNVTLQIPNPRDFKYYLGKINNKTVNFMFAFIAFNNAFNKKKKKKKKKKKTTTTTKKTNKQFNITPYMEEFVIG